MTEVTIAARVLALQKMNTEELRKMWLELNGKHAPDLDLRILRQRLATRIQALVLGGMTDNSKDRLKKATKHSEHKKISNSRVVRPPLGTILTREHQGEKHRVIVTPQGFEYRGEIYKSLTKIANMITGSNWSGPVFFGLKGGKHDQGSNKKASNEKGKE